MEYGNATILFVDAGEQLLRRLRRARRGRRVLDAAESVSWGEFAGRVRERAAQDVAVLNLTAPGAMPLPAADRLLRQTPGLRALYVVDTEQPLSGSDARRLARPGVDFISSRADAQEWECRVERLLTPPLNAPTARRARRLRAAASEATADDPALTSHLMPALHDPVSGRLDARPIAAWLGLSLKTLAGALGRAYPTVHKTPAAAALQAPLVVYLRLASALSHLTGSDEAARAWLNAPNPDLEGQTPRAVLEAGGAETVAALLEDALVGQPG